MYLHTVEAFIASTMDRVYELAKFGEHDQSKMQLVRLEHRARMVLSVWRKQATN